MSEQTTVSVKSVLASEHPLESTVQIQGWLRSVRVSKGGFAFLSVHDGSCFDPVQVVANNDLPNYDDIRTLTTGAAGDG